MIATLSFSSSCLVVDFKQHSAMFKTELGNHEPLCFDLLEVSNIHFGGWWNRIESFSKTIDQYAWNQNITKFIDY